MNADDFFFVHKITQRDEYTPGFLTKFELAVLAKIQGIKVISENLLIESALQPSTIINHSERRENAMHLFAQMMKQNDDKQTEIRKGFFTYNNALLFGRAYKLVGKDFAKFEITKVPLGQRGHMYPTKTMNGLIDAMKFMIRGAEPYLLPHYMHDDTYWPLAEFRKNFK